MHLSQTLLLTVLTAVTSAAGAQYSYYDPSSYGGVHAPRSLGSDSGDDILGDMWYARSADADPDADAAFDLDLDLLDGDVLLARGLHARVADLEDALSLLETRGQGDSKEGKKTQPWKSPTVPGGGGGTAGKFAKGLSKAAEQATKNKGHGKASYPSPAMKAAAENRKKHFGDGKK